tara:strand:+ start:11656 stop:12039 length:384 start_codon:yes stop_codon:yes gene_type:complete
MTNAKKLCVAFLEANENLFYELPFELNEHLDKSGNLKRRFMTFVMGCHIDQWSKEQNKETNEWVWVTYSDVYMAGFLVMMQYIEWSEYQYRQSQCQSNGHDWVNVDTGDAENGPCFHADCKRCGVSV